MIQLTPQMRLLVAVMPVDFRRGIDGLVRVCRETLATDPFSGTVFVFRNRRGTAIKLLAYDGQGFWLCQKRLSVGRFRYWPSSSDAVQRESARSRAGGPSCGRRSGAHPRLAAMAPRRTVRANVIARGEERAVKCALAGGAAT